MKKVLLAKDIETLFKIESDLLFPADATVFPAATNDEILKVHERENADLIVTRIDLPGMKSEELFRIIRNNEELKAVSTIIICEDSLEHRMRCRKCQANAVFTAPVDVPLLSLKARQFLDIARRKPYRAVLAVGIQGSFKDLPRPFWTENISASGMLIRSEEPLMTGDITFFSFFLPDGTQVTGYGKISRAEKLATTPDTFLYGVKFTNIDPAVRAAIEAAVRKEEHR